MDNESAEVDALLQELEEVRAARRELITNGQSVSVSGAFSSTKVKLDELKKREREIMREVVILRGGGNMLNIRRQEAMKHE